MTVENLNITVKTNADKAAAKLLTLGEALGKVQGSAASIGGGAGARAAKSVEQVGKAAEKANKPLGNFLSSLKRIAFYRIIRGIIKSITSAFTEGLEKAYLFSDGIAEIGGHRFAAAMDQMKSSANAMKGQLGSAFISLLTAIMPLILQLISLATKAADAIAQFFAAFTGKNYLKAVEAPAKWATAAGGAAKAAKEWKNQLLGFDEINRLNEPNQGGGGGGANPLEGYDFEASPINEKILAFVEKLKVALEWVKNHMDAIKDVALALGIAFATLELGTLISNILGVGGAFAKIAVPVALLTAGIAMLVLGFREWIETGTLTDKAARRITIGLLAIGAAISLLTGSWIPVLIAGVLSVILNWDKLKQKLDELVVKFGKTFGDGKLQFSDFIYVIVAGIRIAMATIDALIQGFIWLIGVIRDAISWIRGFNQEANARANRIQEDGSIYLQGFASGGFPTEGQLFLANEGSAPEMVGTMGGRTAVANNDQIVEGIRQGVYDAVVAANGNGNGDVQVRVYLDSREIKAGQQRLNRAWGV